MKQTILTKSVSENFCIWKLYENKLIKISKKSNLPYQKWYYNMLYKTQRKNFVPVAEGAYKFK